MGAWYGAYQPRARARQDRFRQALEPIHTESHKLSRDLEQLDLPDSGGLPWGDFAETMLAEARGLSARLLARTAPVQQAPAQDKDLEVYLHDLRDSGLRPARWALGQARDIHRRRDPFVLTVCSDPISNHRILPTSHLLAGIVDGIVELFGSVGQYLPAALILVPAQATVVTFEISDLRGDGGTIRWLTST